VKAIEFADDGVTVKRVEFHAPQPLTLSSHDIPLTLSSHDIRNYPVSRTIAGESNIESG
jgi:hypothetical protein